LDLEKIKQRDKWVCKRCGARLNLDVYKFGADYTENSYITLCPVCAHWMICNKDDAVQLFKKMLIKNKIVLVGDVHGDFERLDKILTDELPFNFFICTGDVGTSLEDMGSAYNIDMFDRWGNKGYFVRGNHDVIECFIPLTLSQEINGLHVAGLNGMIKSRNFIKDTSRNISFREIMYLSHLRGVDILVTHQSPTGMFDRIGEPVLEELLNYLVPRVYVFGHVHKFKLKFHLNTFVISLPLATKGYAVACFQGKDLINLEIVFKKGKRFVRI